MLAVLLTIKELSVDGLIGLPLTQASHLRELTTPQTGSRLFAESFATKVSVSVVLVKELYFL